VLPPRHPCGVAAVDRPSPGQRGWAGRPPLGPPALRSAPTRSPTGQRGSGAVVAPVAAEHDPRHGRRHARTVSRCAA
jgi:hypothetical protein